jgi:putative oxidoreductase
MKSLLTLEFLPRNPDVGLLLLRIGMGGLLLTLHGWGKLTGVFSGNFGVPDVIGIGSVATTILAAFAEFVCSALVVIGLWTRLASVFVLATMASAFVFAHGMKLVGPGNGEKPLLFFIGFLILLLAGAGKYSLDKK